MAEPKHVEPVVFEKISNILIFVALLALVAVVWWDVTQNSQTDDGAAITSFEECVDAGYPVMESMPEQCQDGDGNMFVNTVQFEEVSEDEPGPTTEGVVITGEVVCLPHRDENGPTTAECSFGLLTEDGDYYALQDADEDNSMVAGVEIGAEVEVIGERDRGPLDRYEGAGTVYVNALTALED